MVVRRILLIQVVVLLFFILAMIFSPTASATQNTMASLHQAGVADRATVAPLSQTPDHIPLPNDSSQSAPPAISSDKMVPLPSPTLVFPTDTALPDEIGLDPVAWETWPVIPIVSKNVREIYQRGQKLGNDPRAFSV